MADLLTNVTAADLAARCSDARIVPATCRGFPWLFRLEHR
jgi:hypothetical protein